MDLIEEVRNFARRLSKKIRIKKIILFGSTARGDRLRESDVDLLVISDDFEGMPLNERFRIVYLEWPVNIDADIIPLSEREFKEAKNKSVALRDASKYWIEIDF